MPARKTRRQLADEAFVRNEQLRIDGPPPPPKEYPALEGVSASCPGCKRSWSALVGLNPLHLKDERQSSFLAQAQCQGCGNIYLIPPEEHARIVKTRADHEAAKAAARKAEAEAEARKKENRKNKGAG